MRIRSMLSLAAATAATAVSFATPAQAASDGDYQIHDVNSGRCLTADEGPISGRLTECGPETVWSVRNGGDGTAQLVNRAGNCLAASPARIFPPAVWAPDCHQGQNRWTISGQDGPWPVSVSLGTWSQRGYLTPEGDRVHLLENEIPQWRFERVR